MERKTVAGDVRNRERSKKKFLDAVGQILTEDGYTALKVNHIAARAGLDKKMIYNYFGGTDQLIDEYIRTQDFWSNVKGEKVPAVITDGGKRFSEDMLISQFDFVFQNKELQQILLWRLAEERESLKKLADDQEEVGEALFKNIADPHFGVKDRQFRAIMAILISGAYYLNLAGSANSSIFCGLDTKAEEDRQEIKKALSFLVDATFKGL